VYECFGFFRSDFLNDFTSTRILRKYVSDTSVYTRILKTLRAKTEDSDAPYFIFAVTMQNHSSYSTTYNNFDYDAVTATGLEDVTKLSQYLSLIRESDEALESLISSLETFDEDTIVVFFGDHQPATSVYSKLLTLYGITLDEENSLSDQEMRYTIPIIIWANYDIDEETYEYVSNLVSEGISANYISTLVSLTAGIELTSHQEFLNTLINYYPVITSNVIIDSDGNYYSSYSSGDYLNSDVGGSEMLSEYAMLEYYYLFDGSDGYDFWE
ncbi:MAG: sulfatase-like hydrolase/transferase, partial [Firmicutes bacterium]|nr:sulfatase-like hydrolase/transferase [Bacillota bacterium]